MASEDAGTRARSWQGVVVGALIALAPPIAYLVLAKLIESGTVAAPTGSFNDVLKDLQLNAGIGLILALLGIRAIGRGAGLRSPWAWLALIVIALPVIAFVWFMGYAILGGATGSPF
jgi:hypothetical protein